MSCRDVYFHVNLDSRRLEPYQRVAIAALLSVIVLIFVGAIVRATGAGLGCPDWPFCWGWFVALGIEEAFKVSTAALLD